MRHARLLPAKLAALLVAATVVPLLLAPAPARAAEGLVVLAETRYQVLPEESKVRITIDAVATSFEPDEPDARVFYSGITFAVQPGASNVAATAEGGSLAASIVEETEDYSTIEVTFGRRVFFGESYAYAVTFDLVDAGGAGNRDLRISRSVLAFPVWAFGTTGEPGSGVRVEMPEGYATDVQGGEMSRTQAAGGGTVLSARPDDPFAFFAYISADRPGAFVDTTLSLPVGEVTTSVLVRAWDDDPDWGLRMSELMTDGLPELQLLIGVAYPVVGRLIVEEAATSRLGEYAGIYNDATNTIQVRYDADAFVALHEAAHIWFNGDLFRDRWINEAWAEFYGVSAGERIGASGETYHMTNDLLNARIPLNDWGAIGIESPDVEDFAYAATYELAGLIVERTDLVELQSVWRAADAREAAYQPVHADEPTTGVAAAQPDWQRLLDLLEERTGVGYVDLWETWVVNQEQRPLLDERGEARRIYVEIVEEAGAWELPASIRSQMGAWSFDQATEQLELAGAVLVERDRIEQRAAVLDLEAPSTLRSAFEGDDGPAAAAEEASLELDVLDLIGVTADVVADEPSLLERIGLLGSDPVADLAAARDAFEEGDMADASAEAGAATAARGAARAHGRDRVVLAGAGLLGLNGVALAASSVRRGRRRRALASRGQGEPQ
jgi:predicted kinase